jgi:hypothetical protein
MTKTQVEVITSIERRRRWSSVEKARLAAASFGTLRPSLRRITPGGQTEWKRCEVGKRNMNCKPTNPFRFARS